MTEKRTDLMLSLVEKLFSPQAQDQETIAIRGAITAIFGIVAKYQDVGELDAIDNFSVQEIERDMLQLTAFSMITGIASAKSLVGAKHIHALGKKRGAEAVLQEQSQTKAKAEKFTVGIAEHIKDKERAAYELKEVRSEAEGEALRQITDISNELCQVLKRIHDRKAREMMIPA